MIVDFGCARVLGKDLARFRLGREEDEAALRKVFGVERGCIGRMLEA